MLDPKVLRADPQAVAINLARRGHQFDPESFARLEARRKAVQVETEQLQAQRKKDSREIGVMRGQGKAVDALMQSVTQLGATLEQKEAELLEIQGQLEALLLETPNLLDAEVPDGTDESANQEVRHWGERAEFSFEPQDHVALGEACGGLDLSQAAVMSGARFCVLHGDLARLHRALGQFMLDVHIQEHGYRECQVPYLVNPESLQGTGQLPKFREDLFAVEAGERFLIPTAEVPITNLVRDVILQATELPWKRVAHTPCFRAEAGSYGKDTRGLIRQHQFDKVELVQVVHPEQSEAALEELTLHAEKILQCLKLPYRVMSLCAGDVGFSAARTYDLEVWLPGQQAYREISSCSNFRDFQARRIQARFRAQADAPPQWVHTLNGSGLAVGRTLVAVMENYQREDGSIAVPECLSPWMNGLKQIGGA